MSINLTTRLQEIYNDVYSLLEQANQILSDRGGETADDIYTALVNIASLPSGDDTALISLIERTATEFEIPEGITVIGESAFRDASFLTTVTIPDEVTDIKNHAFANCVVLNNCKLPSNLKTIGSGGFYACKKLIQVEFPELLKSIGNDAYRYDYALESVLFKSHMKEIASSAFANNTNLQNAYVPWQEGEVANAPWGATNATIHYGWKYFPHIEVVKLPDKTRYLKGELFDPTGMVIHYFTGETAYDNPEDETTAYAEYIQYTGDWEENGVSWSLEPLGPVDNAYGAQDFFISCSKNGETFKTWIEIEVGEV